MLYTTGKLLMLIKASINKTVEELHLTDAYVFKGVVESVDDLPMTGNKNGDVYNIGADLNGDNYAWTGTQWDRLRGHIPQEVMVTDTMPTSSSIEPLADNSIIIQLTD